MGPGLWSFHGSGFHRWFFGLGLPGARAATVASAWRKRANPFRSSASTRVRAPACLSTRRDVGLQLRLRLLEGHENARLAELHGAAHEEFRGEQRLAAARAAADQRGPPTRQPATGDFVETLDARRTLGQTSRRESGWQNGFVHRYIRPEANVVK
jgi:hypothetical protein